ncbi:MAG: uncharacterized protein JWR66_1709 [Modestobacter sp.]|nr:uncharacterized protein [Modestobacter sp.]
MVDAAGRVAGFTGDQNVAAAGSRAGHQVVAQGNMLGADAVYESMIDAYESSTAPFAEQLLAALRAAEDNGGDAAGRSRPRSGSSPGSAPTRPGSRRWWTSGSTTTWTRSGS